MSIGQHHQTTTHCLSVCPPVGLQLCYEPRESGPGQAFFYSLFLPCRAVRPSQSDLGQFSTDTDDILQPEIFIISDNNCLGQVEPGGGEPRV